MGLGGQIWTLEAPGGDRWTNEQTDGQEFPHVLQDFVPIGATALLPFNFNIFIVSIIHN